VSADGFSEDGFLDRRLRIAQPRRGFRAGHDSVLLAAAVPAAPGARLAELGAGAGVASLCLASRVPGLEILGIEIDPELVRLATENAARNGFAATLRFAQGDVLALSLPPHSFRHVFFNPPFHPETGTRFGDDSRRLAKQDDAAPREWTRVALELTEALGTVTAILRYDRVGEAIAAAGAESVTVFPLFPHEGEAPKRAILQIVKTGRRDLRTLPGLVLHRQEGGNTEEAESLLRGGSRLRLA
jgi:tRNA1Val (adenine37-N6)-methyltransferase